METKKENDLFYTCSLIEYIARKTKNPKSKIIEKILNLAEIYHSENIDKIADEIIKEANITNGVYNIASHKSNIPGYFDIG